MSLESRLAPLSRPAKVIAVLGLSTVSVIAGYIVGALLMVLIGYVAYKRD